MKKVLILGLIFISGCKSHDKKMYDFYDDSCNYYTYHISTHLDDFYRCLDSMTKYSNRINNTTVNKK